MKTTILILAILASLIPTQTEAFFAPSRIEKCERLHGQGRAYNRLIMKQCSLIFDHLTWQEIQGLGDYGNF